MNYYITAKRSTLEGYQTINLRSNVEFNNDLLYFDDLGYAMKYIYYFNNNEIKVKLKKQDLKKLSKLRLLIYNAPKLEIIYPIDKRGAIVFKQIVNSLKVMKQLKKNKGYIYELEHLKINEDNLYILNDIVINNNDRKLETNTTHYWKNIADVPVNYKLVEVDKKIIYNQDLTEKIYYEDYDYIMTETNDLVPINFRPSVYVYNLEINQEKSYIDVMYQNYMHLKYTPTINANCEFEIIDNSIDSKYYSKMAEEYGENFKRIIWNTTDEVKFEFSYNNEEMRTLATRKVYNNLIKKSKRVKVYGNVVSIYQTELPKAYIGKEKEYNEIQKLKGNKKIYLFQDRDLNADDNAEALYRYYLKNSHDIECYFVLDEKSNDYDRLKKEGFNLVNFKSDRHKELYLQADKLISSHAARRIYDPFYPYTIHRNFENFKFVFLQHGIIMGRHNGFLDYINNDFDIFVASTNEEAALIKDFSGLNCVKNTGLARFDNFKDSKQGDYIIYAPSWNTIYEENLQNSLYVKEIEKVLNSSKINEILKKSNKKLRLIPHPEVINLGIKFKNEFGAEIMDSNKVSYHQELKNCAGLITDYSSLFFDVLYQSKFVVHHQPYELHHENKSLTTFYESIEKTDSIEALENIMLKIAENNWKMNSEQVNNLNQVFTYHDYNNCQRIFDEIEKI